MSSLTIGEKLVAPLVTVFLMFGSLFSRGIHDTPFFFICSFFMIAICTFFLISKKDLWKVSLFVWCSFVALWLFIGWTTLSVIWAYIPGHAFLRAIGWIFIGCVAVGAYGFGVRVQHGWLYVFRTIVFASTLVALHGLYLFASSNYPGARLFFPFGLPNVNAGWLIIPLFISIGLVCVEFLKLQEVSLVRRILSISASVVLMATFILTFSRAAWLMALFGIAVSSILAGRSFWKKSWQTVLFVSVTIGMMALLLSTVAYMPHRSDVSSQWASVLVRNGETKNSNAYTLRLGYMTDAFSFAQQYFPIGAGGQSYEQVMRVHKTDLNAWTTDPHNNYLRLVVEYGIFAIGFFVFLMAMLSYFVRGINTQDEDRSSTMVPPRGFNALIAGGLIASMGHAAMDVNWSYLPVVALHLWTLSFGVGYMSRVFNEKKVYTLVPSILYKKSVQVLTTTLLGVLAIGSSCTLFLVNELRVTGGDSLFKSNNESPGIFRVLYWLDPRIGVEKGIGLMNRIMQGETSLVGSATTEFLLVTRYAPFDSAPYFYLAELAYKGGNVSHAIDLYQQSIEYNKAGSYIERSRLLSLFVEQGMVQDAVTLAKSGLDIYQPYLQSPFSVGDPSRYDIEEHARYWEIIINTAPSVPSIF